MALMLGLSSSTAAFADRDINHNYGELRGFSF